MKWIENSCCHRNSCVFRLIHCHRLTGCGCVFIITTLPQNRKQNSNYLPKHILHLHKTVSTPPKSSPPSKNGISSSNTAYFYNDKNCRKARPSELYSFPHTIYFGIKGCISLLHNYVTIFNEDSHGMNMRQKRM